MPTRTAPRDGGQKGVTAMPPSSPTEAEMSRRIAKTRTELLEHVADLIVALKVTKSREQRLRLERMLDEATVMIVALRGGTKEAA
jgi:hypothetical protein